MNDVMLEVERDSATATQQEAAKERATMVAAGVQVVQIQDSKRIRHGLRGGLERSAPEDARERAAAAQADDAPVTSPVSGEQRLRDPSEGGLPRGPAGAFALLLCAVVPFLMLSISYEVVARRFLGAVPLWINDVTGYLMVALTFLGGAFVMARDGHTRVDLVVARSSALVQHRLALLNATLVLAVSFVLACTAGFSVWDAYQRNLAMVGIIEVPRYVVVSPIFVGSVLLCIERGRRIRALLRTGATAAPSA